MASIHAEVPNNVEIEKSHEIIDRIERDAMEKLGIFLVIHMDPVSINDEKVIHYHDEVTEILKAMDPRCSIHDFRIVNGEEWVNLIFDLMVPREYPSSGDDALVQQINERIQEKESQCVCVITVERSFCAAE
jgi:hypothetical protein